MPRKTKEQNEREVEKTSKSTTASKKTSTSTTKKKTKKTVTTKSKTAKNSASKSSTKAGKTATTTKKAKVSTSKTAATKKKTTKTKTNTKTTTKKSVTAKVKKPEIVEYYDLPYRYNQTTIKLLAQTPTTLFVYWDISDKDRNKFKEQYGEDFFETTKPILIVHNDTLGYSFEVEINDFANCWYLHVVDSKCDYKIELGRRPIVKTEKLNQDYIYVTTSNEIESPNDKILLNKEQKMVYFRNVKTGNQTEKSINTISFIKNMGKIYDIYDLYKAIYKNENVEGIYDSSNPSS